jgi:outer membrane receptor protein involved in Fe transport
MHSSKITGHRRVKKILYLLVAFVIFAAGIFTPLSAKEIEGTIQNVNFKSIDVAKIKLKETGQYFFSRKNGKFVISVPDTLETVTLIISNNFYFTKTIKVRMDRDVKEIKVLMVPRERLQEEMTVTALSYEEKTVSVPMAESVVSEVEIKEKIAENLVETLQNTPGVHFIGAGGFSVTPSIRGLARRRVLLLADGTRITGDRRAGTSGSFIAPELIKRIEVVRSSSSVIYGSDAIGGVVQLFTSPEVDEEQGMYGKNSLNLNYNSLSKKKSGGFTFAQKIGKAAIYTGFQTADAGNYASPEEEILNSGYTNYSGVLNFFMQSKKRELFIGYLGGYGKDVGKPERDNNPNKFTTVPQHINHTFNLRYSEKSLVDKGTLNFQFYLNPTKYTLELTDLGIGSLSFSETTAQNFGLKLNLNKTLSDTLSYQVGVEQYSRTNVDIKNSERASESGPVSTTLPLENGMRSDTGIYFTFDYTGLPGFDFFGGARHTFFNLKTRMDGTPEKLSTSSPSVFLGVTKKLGKSLSVFFNLGRAYRTPSLSEAFYSGLTGRKYVIANPDLKPEKSYNIDSGIKFFSEKVFLGLYLFSYRIDDMIERYRTEDGNYTHDNIEAGNIRGGEIEFQFFPVKSLEIFGNYFYYKGKSKEDVPLNDIPASRFLLGGKVLIEKFWCELNYIYSFKKSNPGPAEIFNEAYNLLDMKAGYYFSASFFLYLKASNLLNESYFANPDPDIPAGRKIDFSAGINFYF